MDTPLPFSSVFGATLDCHEARFIIFAEHASAVKLLLYKNDRSPPFKELQLIRIGDLWHVTLSDFQGSWLYAYQIDGPPGLCNHFNSSLQLLDPYARSVATTNQWGQNRNYVPLGVIDAQAFDWQGVTTPHLAIEDLIIYEMHVRGFTQHSSSAVACPGSYLGIIEKIPYLIDLGINAVELLPVHEFNECEYTLQHPDSKHDLYNYWGYSTVNFFSPMQRYAHDKDYGASIREFKAMVKELHRHGIEVILDVVYNHSAEGDKRGPAFSWKGIDNSNYYLMEANGDYANFSGCGNTFNCGLAPVQKMIVDSLRYWVTEMHVDGFRFDLASILTRDAAGKPLLHPPLIEAITNDPVLSSVKLIAEPWDAAGLYQVGTIFVPYKRWGEWNAKYRDSVRHFIRGGGQNGPFATALCGSQDLYHCNQPSSSINFVTAHDGFTLRDLVSYNSKHNLDNGEDNRDGSNFNESWNCGAEGETQDEHALAIRERQRRNFLLALMISRGVPMVLMGDEYGHTRNGNNNAWCQDNELNWFLWDELAKNHAFHRFFKLLIQFRKEHPLLRRNAFYKEGEIDWHGIEPFKPNWDNNQKFIAFTIKAQNETDKDVYVAFNAGPDDIEVHLPKNNNGWQWIINTTSPSPHDIQEPDTYIAVESNNCTMPSYSALALTSIK